MPSPHKPSLLLGFFLSFLWPGIGHIYFRRIKRGILFAVLGLFLPFIMFIAACIDLYFLSKQPGTAENWAMPDWDVEWKKPLKVFIVAGFVLIVVYSIYAAGFFIFMARFRKDKQALTRQEMDVVSKAIEEQVQEGAYPAFLEDLVQGRPLRKLWLTDAWGTSYRYSAQKDTFELVSAGKDRQFDTSDDIIVGSWVKK